MAKTAMRWNPKKNEKRGRPKQHILVREERGKLIKSLKALTELKCVITYQVLFQNKKLQNLSRPRQAVLYSTTNELLYYFITGIASVGCGRLYAT